MKVSGIPQFLYTFYTYRMFQCPTFHYIRRVLLHNLMYVLSREVTGPSHANTLTARFKPLTPDFVEPETEH